ncbi:hypothetical protein E2I00_010240 [Balaenoptera physalus]|uniref:WH1 domain-containing protein n=1 Tax=Balaenoptera physalus TaxID=9770 RepID=A0A643CB39_BALPH|nr:hypothetical protein E2I00_010240 [Balaenoptera physalus]
MSTSGLDYHLVAAINRSVTGHDGVEFPSEAHWAFCFYYLLGLNPYHMAYAEITLEQPIFSTRAHVFQIDPNTKKNWVPTSKHAVTVSYFYDSTRNVYRIISLDGSKAIINSTITPNMTFTKTSQKFGQWADSRANTVYGLGFSSEHHLSKFAEKFQEFKEAARLAKEKSQEKMELTSTPSQVGI